MFICIGFPKHCLCLNSLAVVSVFVGKRHAFLKHIYLLLQKRLCALILMFIYMFEGTTHMRHETPFWEVIGLCPELSS